MRILHTNMLRGWGGQSNRILTEIEGHLEVGFTVALAAPHDSKLGEKCREMGVEVWPGYRFKPPVQVWNSMPEVFRFRKEVARFKPDIIHAHGSQDTWTAVLAKRLSGKDFPPVIRTKHNIFEWHKHALNKWLYRNVDAYISISSMIDKQIASYPRLADKPRKRIFSVPDLERIRKNAGPVRDRIPNLPEGAFLWGSTGRMRHEKAHEVCLQAFAKLREKRSDAFLVIAGDGSLLEEHRHLAQSLGLDETCLWMPGFRDDVPDLLATFDAYVLASRSEGLGTAILEALAAELPVVATRVGGIPDSVRHEETGLLVPPEDPDALAAAMLRIMEDESLRDELPRNAIKLIESEFTTETLHKETHAFYEYLFSGAP